MSRIAASLLPLSLFLACALACATRPPAPPSGTPRIRDSAPEKVAAHRDADRNLGLEADENRWGFEEARERKRQADEKRRAAAAQPPNRATDLRHTAVPPAGPSLLKP